MKRKIWAKGFSRHFQTKGGGKADQYIKSAGKVVNFNKKMKKKKQQN